MPRARVNAGHGDRLVPFRFGGPENRIVVLKRLVPRPDPPMIAKSVSEKCCPGREIGTRNQIRSYSQPEKTRFLPRLFASYM
jgi:hypothetical protein